MSSKADQRYEFQCRLYAAFCRGRIGAEPSPEYADPETVAHVLGIERVGQPLPGMTEVVGAVAKLLAAPRATDPEKPKADPDGPTQAPSSAPRILSPRVVALLGEFGLDPDKFHCRGRRTPATLAALAARRLIVLSLHVSGMSVDEIAEAAALDPWTVRAHLRAARQSPTA